jgi:hypothetical protein
MCLVQFRSGLQKKLNIHEFWSEKEAVQCKKMTSKKENFDV